jgi:hypothetical protein
MTVNVHNPDQYMASLRTIIAQGRKKIGLLVGAGAPAGMAKADGTYPLIPAVAGLTEQVLSTLNSKYAKQIAGLKAELDKDDIETILSRVRALAKVIGNNKVHDQDSAGFETFGEEICTEIGKIVDARLPKPESAYSDLISWITGTSRDHSLQRIMTSYSKRRSKPLGLLTLTASQVGASHSSTQFQCRETISPLVGHVFGNFMAP